MEQDINKKERSQSKKLAIFAVVFTIIAVILGLVLFDMTFVPSGSFWDELKESFIEWKKVGIYDEAELLEINAMTDSETWKDIKQTLYNNETIPFPSGIICWFMLDNKYKEEMRAEAELDKKTAEAEINAQNALNIINSWLSENKPDIPETIELDIVLKDKAGIYDIQPYEFSCVFPQEFLDKLSHELSFDSHATLKLLIMNGKCTSAAFAPDSSFIFPWSIESYDINGNVTEYICRYYDENGHYIKDGLHAGDSKYDKNKALGIANAE